MSKQHFKCHLKHFSNGTVCWARLKKFKNRAKVRRASFRRSRASFRETRKFQGLCIIETAQSGALNLRSWERTARRHTEIHAQWNFKKVKKKKEKNNPERKDDAAWFTARLSRSTRSLISSRPMHLKSHDDIYGAHYKKRPENRK